jgi:hypothetical protein
MTTIAQIKLYQSPSDFLKSMLKQASTTRVGEFTGFSYAQNYLDATNFQWIFYSHNFCKQFVVNLSVHYRY